MNRKTLTIIVLQALIIVVMFWLLVFYGQDEYESYAREEQEEEIASAPRVSSENGAALVTLSAETQRQSGILTSPLAATAYRSALTALGAVVGLEGYGELRARYLAARAEAAVVRASLANSQQEYQRLLQLNRDNRNVSDRALAAAEAAWKGDEAKLAAAETAAASVRDLLRQQWGDTLAAWAAEQPAGAALQRLLQHQDALLQVTLPLEAPAPGKGATLLVEPAARPGKPVRALFVSLSPQTDPALQGRTYFFRAPAEDLRIGMRVRVHQAAPGKAMGGVIVPNSAIVWYGGKAWVYQKQGDDRFLRREVSTEREAGDGWFNTGGVEPGDEVVTSGAQLLLSEEFKYQITNENED